MENLIESKLKDLMALQAIDCELDHIVKMRGALPEEVSSLSHELKSLETRAKSLQNELTELEEDIARQRVHIKEAEALVKKYEQQQMNVRNNREYDAITKEVDLQQLEKQLAEKRIKEAYEHIDKEKIVLEQAQTTKEKTQQVLIDKQQALEGLIEASKEDEQNLNSQRKKVVQRIEQSLLNTYERIKASVRNNFVVVPVRKKACGGCFSAIPPQQQVDVLAKKRLIICEHCGRILTEPPSTDIE